MARARTTRQRKPSRAVRRANSARPPRAAALAMTKLIRARLSLFEKEIERLLFPVLEQLVPHKGVKSLPDAPDARTRVDARIPSFITARLSALDLHLIEIFDERELDDALDVIGKRVLKKNATEIRRVVGISIRDADPGVAAQIDSFRELNVGKIKSLAGQQLVDITKMLDGSERAGERVEVLRDRIQKRFDVTKSKAALLARDQTLTLNAQITRTRHTNLGIVEYIWTTSGDERVRETHADLDGTTQRWDTPPVVSDDGRTAHPGEDFQCRCTPYPVLPELG